jgi:SAM-dependent methyltransferase
MPHVKSAEHAYNCYAPRYDECNSQNNYELWLGKLLLPILNEYGLRKGWALDGGCGTGPSFEPLLSRGWNVVGCDVSPGMLQVAHRKYGSRVPLFHADLRSLPTSFNSSEQPLPKEFQVILTLNDVVNCLTEPGDLEEGFSGAKGYLSHDGLLMFDTNLLSVYRTSSAMAQRMDKHGLEWRALSSDGQAGSIFEEQLSGPEIEAHVHRQRHWTDEQVKEALEASGLRCLATLGQSEPGGEIVLADTVDEERDYKAIYIAGCPG